MEATIVEKSVTILSVGNQNAAAVIRGALESLFPNCEFSVHVFREHSGYVAYNIDWHQSPSHRAYNSVRFAAKGAAAAIGAPVR